jgi:hypothetical protein
MTENLLFKTVLGLCLSGVVFLLHLLYTTLPIYKPLGFPIEIVAGIVFLLPFFIPDKWLE